MKTAQGGFFNMYSGAHPPPPPSPPFRAAPSSAPRPSPRALPLPPRPRSPPRAKQAPHAPPPLSAAGFSVSVVGIVAYRGPYFGIFDTLKEKNPFKKEKGIVGLASKFCIAQFTAIVAGFISYPFDTVAVACRCRQEATGPVAVQWHARLRGQDRPRRGDGRDVQGAPTTRVPPVTLPLPLTQTARLLSPRATAHRPFITRSRPSSLPWLLPVFPTSLLSPFLRPTLLAPPLARTPAPCTSRAILFPPRFPLPSPSSMPIAHTLRTLHAWSALHSTHDQHALSAGIRRQRSPHPGRRLVLVGYDEIKRIG